MNKSCCFLTEVAQDWSEHNLSVLQKAIQDAEEATLARTNTTEDPLLDTPNLANLRGVLRWHMVQKHLAMAVEKGLLDGIAAEWVDLGGVHVLELKGKCTSVTTHHLMEPDEAPRDSAFRRRGREVNEVSPLLKGFEYLEQPQDALLHLVLVHGGKTSEFAYLRAYTDSDDRSIHKDLSKNIKLMPVLLPSIEFEPVSEPLVALNPAAEQSAASEGGA